MSCHFSWHSCPQVRPVPGQPVTWGQARISYLPPVLPRQERRARLQRQYYFHCQCTRCQAGGEQQLEGSALCKACGKAVALSEGECSCGEEVPAEARIAGAFLDTSGSCLARWARLGEVYSVLDWRMVEVGEGAMQEALDEGKFIKFLEVGAKMLEAYRKHLPIHSPSLGLHLAKLAKVRLLPLPLLLLLQAAILLERSEEGLAWLKEAKDIFSLSLGPSSPLVTYCSALRHTA